MTIELALLARWSVRQKLHRVSSVQFNHVALYAFLGCPRLMSYQPASGQLVGRSLLSGAHHPTSLFPASVAAGALSWPPLPPTGSLFGLTLLGPGPSLFGPPCFTPVPAPPLPPPPHLPLMSALCHPTATVSDRFVAAASRLAAPPANGADITNDCATTAAVCHNVDDRRLSLYYRTSREQEWQ